MMTVADDKGPAGSSKRHSESATGRIGDDVQRAKENISGAAVSARDDIAADLRRLSADVTSLKDTVAALAKTVTAEVGEAAAGIGGASHRPRRTKQTPCFPNSRPSHGAIRWASSLAHSESAYSSV